MDWYLCPICGTLELKKWIFLCKESGKLGSNNQIGALSETNMAPENGGFQ